MCVCVCVCVCLCTHACVCELFDEVYGLVWWALYWAWFQSSAAKEMRTALFWAIMHHYSWRNNPDECSSQLLTALQNMLRRCEGCVVCFQVLHPCDIELVKSFKSVDDGLKMTATVSTIDVHLSASTVRTVSSVSTPDNIYSSRHDLKNFAYASLCNKLFKNCCWNQSGLLSWPSEPFFLAPTWNLMWFMLVEVPFEYILIIAMSYRTGEHLLTGSLASYPYLTQPDGTPPDVIHLNRTQSSSLQTELM